MGNVEKYMDNKGKYLDQRIEEKSVNFETPSEFGNKTISSLIIGILRRWRIVILTFLIMCGTAIPAIWFLIKPLYSVTGAIRVAPIIPNILTGEADRGEISNYQNFMYTQADIITSSRVVHRVADDLADRNLSFFEERATKLVTRLKQTLQNIKAKPEPSIILKEAIFEGIITVAPERHSELIKITMKSTKPEEAEEIVNAFIRNYMATEVSSSAEGENQKLTILENERGLLANKLESQREKILELAQEYGSKTLTGRHDMKLQRVASLLAELTKVEARRIQLEVQVRVLEQTEGQTVMPQELLKMREEYINNDPTVRILTTDIVKLDKELIAARQALTPANSELERQAKLLEELKKRLKQYREEAGKNFDDIIAAANNKELINKQAELEETKIYEERLREMLAEEDTETIGLGRKQLAMQDLQDQSALIMERHDGIDRRIQELEMERKRPARISVAYNADIAHIRDKRVKYSIAMIVGAFACGIMLAYLRDRAEQILRTPEDVERLIGIRIAGTTTASDAIKKSIFAEQTAREYQTIRANLGFIDGEKVPKKLVITSSEIQEGKTTFAINLSSSIAKSGKKVLLIDGDLKKPDIAYLLNLPKDSKGLSDVLLGEKSKQGFYSMPSNGLDVLAADSRYTGDAYELLSSPSTAEFINTISQDYEHVIIDAPSVLASPDTLVWAKIADAVILISFSGHTTAPKLKEAKQRLTQINVSVLGTILINVRAGQGYHYQSYDDRAKNTRSLRNATLAKRALLPVEARQDKDKSNDSKTAEGN